MKKVFVLDTNVLLLDPNAIFKFTDNEVIVPMIVIEELDRFKRDQNENGRNARWFSRIVDDLRNKGSLFEGVALEHGGLLKIVQGSTFDFSKRKLSVDITLNDNLILATALAFHEEGRNTVLVSKDINLRLKADALGISAEEYGIKDVTLDELYTGCTSLEIPIEDLRSFEKDRFLEIMDAGERGILPNEYVIMNEQGNDRYRMLGRYSHEKKGIVPLVKMKEGVWRIHPKNIEQQFAIDALLNDEVKLVSLVGRAGTGKTLLAIAAGLEKTINEEKYSKLLVSRPIQPMGKDLGFLPGDVNEKLAPWMQPIFDNMDFLFGRQRGENAASWDELINQGLLHVEPLTYIRGRSIPEQFMIVDEAQNLTPHEIKTIITRVAEGTKIVLTGDCQQIDSPYLDSINNGLAYCVDRMKGENIVAHTTLSQGERSALSEAASKLL